MTTDRILSPVELTQIVVSGSRVLHSRIHLIDDAAQAAQIAAVLDELIPAAQQLRALALAVADSDAQVEAAAQFDEVMSHLDEGGAL
ncbi:hypothetical protein [Glycomyces arizonensis]|uniref:hypothetical protein n=1 Tax=Glycomyces arizonensis TaxID=256035 RepID=UPI000423C7EF|nr:hypothetical protein [Glycomyces arizonensis]